MKSAKFLLVQHIVFLLTTLPSDVYTFKRVFRARYSDLAFYGLQRFGKEIHVTPIETCLALCYGICSGFAYSSNGDCQLVQHNKYPGVDMLNPSRDYKLFLAEPESESDKGCRRDQILDSELTTHVSDICKYIR
jgi:hypothetical protein